MKHNKEDILGNLKRAFSAWPDKLESHVRDHLRKVYSTLALTMLSAILGIVVNAVMDFSSLLPVFSLLELGFLLALMVTNPSHQNENKRLGFMYAFAFLFGCEVGPLIEYVGIDDPTIVFNAIFVTMLVFGFFTMSALYTDSTKYLHLGDCCICLVCIAPFGWTGPVLVLNMTTTRCSRVHLISCPSTPATLAMTLTAPSAPLTSIRRCALRSTRGSS
ncbi:hypothetical protein niasHT_001651 [Heterodera trifolii]|uniref:Bax inhibitor 1 n=1 Tax=Heterodera trifolii TaxID=157864 RepID=A0ABD2M3V4_9BILA